MNLANNQIYSAHGVGSRIVQVKDKKVRITNLLGSSVHMGKININNPVKIFRQFLNTCEKSDYHIVDFHAETTGEKKAFFLEFAGQVDVIVGTHTHVQTNDAHVFNNTAFITDLGMSGAFNSVIGAEPDTILAMYREEVARFTLTPAKGKYQLNGALINFTDTTNTVKDITPIYLLEK
jgi:calcineurin-like phosphoesterase